MVLKQHARPKTAHNGGKRHGAIGIAHGLDIDHPAGVGLCCRVPRNTDLPPDRHLGLARGRLHSIHRLEYCRESAIRGPSSDLAVVLGRGMGHSVRADRALASTISRRLLDRCDRLWRDRADPRPDVRGLPAARSAGRRRFRDEPGSYLPARARPVGARHGVDPRRADRLAQPAELTGSARYSTTRSARSNRDCGIVIPMAVAAFRLITSSNWIGSSTGSVAASAPLAILSM